MHYLLCVFKAALSNIILDFLFIRRQYPSSAGVDLRTLLSQKCTFPFRKHNPSGGKIICILEIIIGTQLEIHRHYGNWLSTSKITSAYFSNKYSCVLFLNHSRTLNPIPNTITQSTFRSKRNVPIFSINNHKHLIDTKRQIQHLVFEAAYVWRFWPPRANESNLTSQIIQKLFSRRVHKQQLGTVNPVHNFC